MGHLELPSLERIEKSFNLHEDGTLTHKSKCGFREGSKVGNVMPTGYIRVNIGGKLYLAHRLIYKLFYGVDPMEMEVDHIDGNKENNKPSNLRLATRSQNRQNIGAYKSNKLNTRGVWFEKSRNGFFCAVQKSKKRKYYGPFKTREEAFEVYKTESKKKFGDFYPEGKI